MIKKYIVLLCLVLVSILTFWDIRADSPYSTWRGYTGDSIIAVCGKDNTLAVFRRKQRYYWIDKKSRKGEISIPASTLTLYETNWYFDKILNTRFANRIYLLGNIGFVIIDKGTGNVIFYMLENGDSKGFRSSLQESYYNSQLNIQAMIVYKFLSGQLSYLDILKNFSLVIDLANTIIEI